MTFFRHKSPVVVTQMYWVFSHPKIIKLLVQQSQTKVLRYLRPAGDWTLGGYQNWSSVHLETFCKASDERLQTNASIVEVELEAKLRQHGEIAIVCIHGPLDIERTQPFRDACARHFLGNKVIFNFENANFVGSTGINSFVEAMRIVSSKSTMGLKLVGLKTEFRRIFSNIEIQGLEICETEVGAIESFNRPVQVIPDLPENPSTSDSNHG